MTAAGHIEASFWDWSGFFLYRGLARWGQEFPAEASRLPWRPVCGSWEHLEDLLFERFGSVTSRWYPPTTPAPWTCLVCKDTQAIVDGRWCPACNPAPLIVTHEAPLAVPDVLPLFKEFA